MTRSIGPCPDAPRPADSHPGCETRTYEIEVVTPLFGGGVEPGVADPVTPVRATAIRGHLRFWWRATRGAARETAEALRKRERETEIWGDTENPSPVLVEIGTQPEIAPPSGQRNPDDSYGFRRLGPEGYALFSAQQNGATLTREGIRFTLKILWPCHGRLQEMRDQENRRRRQRHQKELRATIHDIRPDVEMALWAWLNYGGLGSRTRRGCGALHLMTASHRLPDISPPPGGIRIFEGPPADEAMKAWAAAVGVYQDFRQSFRGRRHDKSLPGGKVLRGIPGRSRWPEPDSIRHVTGCALRRSGCGEKVPDDVKTHDHTRPIVPATAIPSFPRAALGLPIIFHFADGPGHGRPARPDSDPADVELVPEVMKPSGRLEKGGRMASGVVTRPLFRSGHWHPAIILLGGAAGLLGAFLTGRSARWCGRRSEDLCERITPGQLSVPPDYVGSPTAGGKSVIGSLVGFACEKGFKEVRA